MATYTITYQQMNLSPEDIFVNLMKDGECVQSNKVRLPLEDGTKMEQIQELGTSLREAESSLKTILAFRMLIEAGRLK